MIQQINREAFENLVRQDKPVLVDFQAPWCVYCRRIAPALEQLAPKWADRLEIVQIDIDDEAQLADEQGVEIVPTLALYRGGERLGELIAPDSAARIEDFLREGGV